MEAVSEITAAVKNVPALRFLEFEGEWEESRLGDGVKLISGQHLGPDDYNTEVKGEPYFTGPSDFTNEESQVTKWTNSSKHFGKKGDVLITVKGSGVGTMTLLGLPKVAMGRQLMAIKSGTYNSEFIYHLLLTKKNLFVALASGNMIPGITRQDILTLKLKVPTTPEQKKIASFLSAVDDKVQQISKKKALLEKYKKGVMQQIFTQQIRFKDDNGNDYPEWDECALGGIIVNLSSGVSVNSEDRNVVGDNEYGILKTSCISSGKFYSSENKKIVDNELTRAKLNPVADTILISRMNTPQLVGESGYVSIDYPYLFVPDRLWLASTDNTKASAKWLSYFLTTDRTKAELTNIATGTSGSMKNISKPNFLNIRAFLPTVGEQVKIANFLTSIDNKINYTSEQLEQAQQFKKGLLQQLFV